MKNTVTVEIYENIPEEYHGPLVAAVLKAGGFGSAELPISIPITTAPPGLCGECRYRDTRDAQPHPCAASDEDGLNGSVVEIIVPNQAHALTPRRAYIRRTHPKCTLCGHGYCAECGAEEWYQVL